MSAFPVPITALYAGINGLILLALAVLVSVTRLKTKIDLGDGGNPTMLRAIRVHGNNSEYVPVTLVLMVALELMAAPGLFLHGLGGGLTLGRLLHAQGLTRSPRRTFGRAAGTFLTWLALFAAALACLYYGLLALPL